MWKSLSAEGNRRASGRGYQSVGEEPCGPSWGPLAVVLRCLAVLVPSCLPATLSLWLIRRKLSVLGLSDPLSSLLRLLRDREPSLTHRASLLPLLASGGVSQRVVLRDAGGWEGERDRARPWWVLRGHVCLSPGASPVMPAPLPLGCGLNVAFPSRRSEGLRPLRVP